MTVQYQGVWSLQSAAQLQSTQRWVTDPLFDYNTLLLQADDAANGAQNNTFLDSSSNSFAITRNGNTTQGSFTPFSLQPGAWSNFFGGSGNYLKTGTLSAISTTATTFTVECWVYMTQLPSGNIPVTIGDLAPDSNTANWTFGPINSGKVRFYWFTGSSPYAEGNTVLALNTWHHIAVSISSATISIYVNGVKESLTGTTTLTNRSSTLNYIGFGQRSAGGEIFYGYVSNARIVSGAALYSGDVIAVPSTPLGVASSGTTQLITCQSNRFLDNSSNAVSITPTGSSMTVQPFSPFAPQFQWTPSVIGGSGYFDGTGDNLTAAGNAAFAFGTGDFTVAAWLYPTAATTFTVLSSNYNFSSGSGNWSLYFGVGSAQSLFFNSGSGNKQSTVTTTIPLNAWTHVAYTRVGTTGRFFVNGAQLGGTISDSFNYGGSSGNLFVGQQSDGTGLANGYMTSIQVLKGTGYSSLPIPTAPATNIANTSFLLNFTNAGIYDGTMKNNLETVGNAQVSTAVVKYGSGSMFFDGTGDLLFSPASQNYSFPGDFTIECWVNTSTISTEGGSYRRIFATGPDATKSIQQVFSDTVTTSSNVSVVTNSFVIIGTISVATGAWVHVALTRLGSAMRLFVNGVQSGSTLTTTQAFTGGASNGLFIGSASGGTGRYLGYIDDFRITRGIARYTQNFIPPSVALPRQ